MRLVDRYAADRAELIEHWRRRALNLPADPAMDVDAESCVDALECLLLTMGECRAEAVVALSLIAPQPNDGAA